MFSAYRLKLSQVLGYFITVQLSFCYAQGKHKESRSYGLTDCACKAVVFEACTIIECHAFRRHPRNKCTTEDIVLKTMLYWTYYASNYSAYVPVKCVGCPKSSKRFRKISDDVPKTSERFNDYDDP